MQPPPQAAPAGLVGPPPVGNPRNVFWPSSSYRRAAPGGTVPAPVVYPPQPVTDPFAFSRRVAQDPSLDVPLRGSLPLLPVPPVFSQHMPLPVPHTNVGDPPQAPYEPVPSPVQQPVVDASRLSSTLTLATQPGLEASRSADMRPSPASDFPTPSHPPLYIPGVSQDSPHGVVPGPTRPLSRQNPHGSTGPVTASSFFPQQMSAQGSPRASGQHYPPCPEGAGHSTVAQAPGLPRFPVQPDTHQGPGPEQQNQALTSVPTPLPGEEMSETAHLQSRSHTPSHCDPEEEVREHPRARLAWVSQEFRPDSVPGNGPDYHQLCPPGLEAGSRVEASPGTLAMFFRGAEAENEENLSTEKASPAGLSAFDALGPNSGLDHPSALVGTGGLYQSSLQGPLSEATPQGGDSQQCFSQRGQPDPGHAAVRVWGTTAGPEAPKTLGSQCENVEDLEFVQNQEVLPSEPRILTPSSSNDPFRYGVPPGPPAQSLAGSGGLNLEAPDTPPQPARPDSVSSSYGGKGQRGLPSAARPQDLGTFIQQEVGKPEEETSDSFFKQIDSSPVGGETEERPVIQSYHHNLSQPATPSPPKPMGIFQTSANSSFEPVKSHHVEVRPVEADHANVVAEVRGSHGHLIKRGAGTTSSNASPGNLEQPPDNMETLSPAPACQLPLSTAAEASHVLPHTGGPPAEASILMPDKRPLARAHGSIKCESPVTTLWAQNELPDFGGNVLLAPASPALCVPVKPRASQVLQPPDEGTCGHSQLPGSASPPHDGLGPSENLENPPKVGEEEAHQSQASSSYASLLSLLPAECLHSQPVLVTQPGQSCQLAQPTHFPVSLLNHEKTVSQRDPVVGERPTLDSSTLGELGDCTPSETAPGTLGQPPPSALPQSGFSPGSGADVLAKLPAATLMGQPPVNVTPGSKRIAESASPASRREENSEALDYSLNQTLGNPLGACCLSPSKSHAAAHQTPVDSMPQQGLGPHNPDHFYQQVTKAAQGQKGPERAQLESGPPQQPALAPQEPRAALPEPSSSRSPPAAAGQALVPGNSAPGDTGQHGQPWPQSSSASITSTSSSQAARRSEPQWPPPLPPDLAYYYYRSLYDAYPAQYPPEPGAAHLYYQEAYRPYDSADVSTYTENYRGPETERPAPRLEYPDGHYGTKGGWSSQSDYYANYYSPYGYGDPGRWDRYHYGSRYRDAQAYGQRCWYDAEYNPYCKEPYTYGDRLERDNDPWRYDPRFSSSFEEDPELRRDPYGDEGDRRSVHSEHSARSLHSRCSSLSSHSQQSQMCRNHGVGTGPYDVPAPPESFHGDYGYSTYSSNFNGMQPFPEYGYPADPSWPAVDSAPSRPRSPEKFSVPHVCARFAPGGQLIKVIPNLPSEGQPTLVEVHSVETLLQHSPEQEEMRAFPGPLGKDDTHKVDVINFAQNKATKCFQNENIIDKESASLLWSFIVLLCRQNGTVVGTDIAELLLRDHKTVWLPGKSPNEANLIDFTNEALEQAEEESGEAQLSFLTDTPAAGTSGLEKETERFRELLLYGRKKDALESAMKNGLWGHALLLASKMDNRTHARVMTRFANSLPINDPLQTVYQLLSGRMPAASTCCGDEKWGDWRPHLAMILSNLNNNVEVESRAMTTMGDTLASKGLLDAAHFCYLMAEAGFGVYTKKATKLVLIGSNHSLPFLKFATNEAIQRTEAYEYAQSLGAHTCLLPHFQVFKFIYACRLADMGLATQAFHYCEAIAKSVLAQPCSHSPVLVSQLIQVASRLRTFDPQLKEKPEEESSVEPAWLAQLQRVEKQIQEGTGAWQQDGGLPLQCPSTPSSEAEQYVGPGPEQSVAQGLDNPLLAVPQPSAEFLGSVQLLPSAPQTPPTMQLPGPARVPLFPVLPPLGPSEPMPPGPALGFPEPSWTEHTAQHSAAHLGQQDELGIPPGESPLRSTHSDPREEASAGDIAGPDFRRPSPDSEPTMEWEGPDSGGTPPSEVKRPVTAARKEDKEPKKSSEPWFFRWLPGKKRTEAYLPDDKNKSIVWDEKKNRWVNLSEPEEEKKAPPPPPMTFPKTPQTVPPGPGGPPRATVNVFSRKAGGNRAHYVDVLNPGKTTRKEPAVAPTELFAPLAPLPIPAHLFVPGPGSEEPQPAGAVDSGGQVPAGGQDRPEPTLDTRVNSTAQPLGSELGADALPGGKVPGAMSPAGGPSGGPVPFYSPAQFAHVSAASGSSRLGRISQRKHVALN